VGRIKIEEGGGCCWFELGAEGKQRREEGAAVEGRKASYASP
jgi:hypothetical protein